MIDINEIKRQRTTGIERNLIEILDLDLSDVIIEECDYVGIIIRVRNSDDMVITISDYAISVGFEYALDKFENVNLSETCSYNGKLVRYHLNDEYPDVYQFKNTEKYNSIQEIIDAIYNDDRYK